MQKHNGDSRDENLSGAGPQEALGRMTMPWLLLEVEMNLCNFLPPSLQEGPGWASCWGLLWGVQEGGCPTTAHQHQAWPTPVHTRCLTSAHPARESCSAHEMLLLGRMAEAASRDGLLGYIASGLQVILLDTRFSKVVVANVAIITYSW